MDIKQMKAQTYSLIDKIIEHASDDSHKNELVELWVKYYEDVKNMHYNENHTFTVYNLVCDISKNKVNEVKKMMDMLILDHLMRHDRKKADLFVKYSADQDIREYHGQFIIRDNIFLYMRNSEYEKLLDVFKNEEMITCYLKALIFIDMVEQDDDLALRFLMSFRDFSKEKILELALLLLEKNRECKQSQLGKKYDDIHCYEEFLSRNNEQNGQPDTANLKNGIKDNVSSSRLIDMLKHRYTMLCDTLIPRLISKKFAIPSESALSILHDTGEPVFHKLNTQNINRTMEVYFKKELPINIPIENKYIFHSYVVCPVLKVICSDKNQPVLLECKHVISREAVRKLNIVNDIFKCPYCPKESSIRNVHNIII